MLQFYALSVIFNFAGGLLLCSEYFGERFYSWSKFDEMFNTQANRFIIGTIAFITGFFKLLTPVGKIVIIGDLVPALAGLFLGFVLFVDYLKEGTRFSSEQLDSVTEVIERYKTLIGGGAIFLALIHFAFADVILL